jgi:hypothetical protein
VHFKAQSRAHFVEQRRSKQTVRIYSFNESTNIIVKSTAPFWLGVCCLIIGKTIKIQKIYRFTLAKFIVLPGALICILMGNFFTVSAELCTDNVRFHAFACKAI